MRGEERKVVEESLNTLYTLYCTASTATVKSSCKAVTTRVNEYVTRLKYLAPATRTEHRRDASTPRQWSQHWIRLGRPRPLTRLGSPLHPHGHKHTTQAGNEEKARATQPLNCTDQRSLTGPEPHADMPSMCPSAYLGALAMHARLLPPRMRVRPRLRPLPPHTRATHQKARALYSCRTLLAPS